MTDPTAPAEPGPVDPDVELASAHLDGEADERERERLLDAGVQSHLGAFRAVSERVRDVPPAPPGLVDEQVARALEAFDGEAQVVPLERRSGTPWWQRIPLGAVAAAVVAVALVGALTLASTPDDDEADTATAALESADETRGESGVLEDSGDAAGSMEQSTAADSGEQFEAVGEPRFDSYAALADALRDELVTDPTAAEAPTASGSGSGGGSGAPGDPCGAVALLGLDPGAVVVVRGAVVSADEVTAVVHEADGGRRLTVVGDATCTVVFDQVLSR